MRIEIYRALGDIYAGIFIERADEDTVVCREIGLDMAGSDMDIDIAADSSDAYG